MGGNVRGRKLTWLKNINLWKEVEVATSFNIKKFSYELIFQTNAVILEPVSFELEVARNVTGALKPSDPADIKVSGNIFVPFP